MRRLLSLFILSVFLFNMGGYYLMYWGLRYQSAVELRLQLDAGTYPDHSTVTIRLPMSLPYPMEKSDFERLDGEFEFNGEFYKLVKQQFRNDTLYVVCIKDQFEKQIVGEMNHYTQLAHDLPGSSHPVKLQGRLFADYTSGSTLDLAQHTTGWIIGFTFASPEFAPRSLAAAIDSPPPREV